MDAKKFGNFIAQARREQKLTQAQLAQRLHVTDKAVSRWERGLGFPDIGTIEPLALILGLSVVELIKSERILDSQISCSDASDLLKEAFTLMNEQEKLTLKKMDDQNVVKQQYATADALRGRISLHDRYSTNKFGWFNWLYAQYNFKPGCRILELGCGDGRFWAEHFDKLPEGVSLTLSDVSGKMLETARQMVGHENEITYRVIDAQDIPLPDGSVDIVIANMMLYHLPDLSRALIEIRRVMQDDGVFYCATGGENGIDNYIRHALHLPVQHGNNRILQSMNRRYTREQYLSRVALLRSKVPDISLTTDLIVGYPGETEEEFEDTCSLVREVGYDSAFTFIYSPRVGTRAAEMEGQIPEDVASRRIQKLIAIQKEITHQRYAAYIGQVHHVLVEEASKRDEHQMAGKDEYNITVNFPGTADLIGQIVPVRITSSGESTLRGERIL